MMLRTLCLAAGLARVTYGLNVGRQGSTNAIDGFHGLDLGDDDGAYHYMPAEKVLMCACAKCGSTSVYEFLYSQALGRPWNYSGTPYIQDVTSPRWEGKFKLLDVDQARTAIQAKKVFSFALMRDPKSRIISSWKSKVACDGEVRWGTDLRDRARMLPKLAELAGVQPAECLEFEDFVATLAKVHRMGQAKLLNVHFRPQQHGCFRDFDPPQWSKVANIADANAAHELAMQFGNLDVKEFPHMHSSPASGAVNMTDRAQRLLDEITHDEYALLATRRTQAF